MNRLRGIFGILVAILVVGVLIWLVVSIMKLLILLLPLALLVLGGYLAFRYLRKKLV